MSRVYLDACSIIYLVEATNPIHDAVVARVLQYQTDPAARIMTSRLSCLECRTRPLRDNDNKLLATYERFFKASDLVIVEITSDVIERATALRARHNFKTPDAIHLASAIEAAADRFLTGDATLARCRELAVDLIETS